MAKSLNQIAHEYAMQNPNVSIELAFLEGLLYRSKNETEKIEARRNKFQQEVASYIPMYGRQMTENFFEYWSELNKSGTKMKFETEKTWELSKRLSRWSKNNFVRNNNTYQSKLQIGQIVNDKQSEEILFKANF